MAPPPVQNATRRELSGLLFLAAVGEAFQAYGTLNSSPQTTELFASARERTLMKYVLIGNGNALFFGAAASWIARSLWPLAGTLGVIAEMHLLYKHAARAGKDQAAPTLADTGPTGGRPRGRP